MNRYKPYSRREFRQRFHGWMRRNAKLVWALSAGFVGLIALGTVGYAMLLPSTRFTWWMVGVFQATIVAIYFHTLNAAFLGHDREAIRHLRGAWGEENTRGELQRAKRKRLIWGWVDSVSFQIGDVDHLVVTRRGGLVAVDSKWRSDAGDTVDMARAAKRAGLRAEALARTLISTERRAHHRAKTNPLPVTPVVVLWGAAQHDVPDGAQVDGIEFVGGRHFLEWLTKLDGQLVTKSAACEVVTQVKDYRASAWEAAQVGTA